MNAPQQARVLVRTFRPGDEDGFRRLNVAWISKYFGLEVKDLQSFDDPETKIVAKGGQIFIAEFGGVAVGCVALLKMSDGEFELAKMATNEAFQRRGIGRALMDAAIAWAREHRATRLYLETNHTLAPALHLYESSGFTRILPQKTVYKRADVFMEMVL